MPAPLPARACPHSPTYMTQTTRHQQSTEPSTTLPPLITRAARCRCTMPQFHADHAPFSCRRNTPSAAAAASPNLRLTLPPFPLPTHILCLHSTLPRSGIPCRGPVGEELKYSNCCTENSNTAVFERKNSNCCIEYLGNDWCKYGSREKRIWKRGKALQRVHNACIWTAPAGLSVF